MIRIGSMFMLTLGVLSLTGCATARQLPESRLTTVTEWRGTREEPRGEAMTASALAFAPPISTNDAALDLDRSHRQPGAFFGYIENSVETYSLTVDDRQVFDGAGGYGLPRGGWYRGGYGSGWYDRYDRRAYSERTGTIRR